MRSIPLAITWEMLRRGRWTLIAAALGANALPVILFAALSYDGAIDPAERSQIDMHVVMIQINWFMFGTAVIGALGPLSRLYVYPVPTASLVAWHMLLAMAALSAESVISTALLNWAFDLRWPLLCGGHRRNRLQVAVWSGVFSFQSVLDGRHARRSDDVGWRRIAGLLRRRLGSRPKPPR
jgi:hypothetical protein